MTAVAVPDEKGPVGLLDEVGAAASRLGADGLLWVFSSRRRRGMAEQAVRRVGLSVVDVVLPIPRWPGAAHLVPVAPTALADAGTRHLGLRPTVARLAGAVAAVRIGRVALRRTARECALVAAREAHAETFRWLGELDGRGVGTATASISARTDARVATVLRYLPGSRLPDIAAKVALDRSGRDRLRREREALALLGRDARRAGAAVPESRGPEDVPWLLVTDVLPGRPGAARLAGDRGRAKHLVAAVGSWLTEWNRATARMEVATPALLERVLFHAAEVVLGAGVVERDYEELLRRLVSRVAGRPIVVVAAHNDLTMANVLESDQRVAVIDWESASPTGLPLTDLWYFLADVSARVRRTGHVDAVAALVAGSSTAAPFAGALDHLTAVLSLPPEQAAIAFHATWLHHAANELSRGERRGPFLRVVQAVASGRIS
ncbi:MAG: hypothetical protein M3N32_06470 [Actinomycetota bacterium]|nr:hypothetical protein [Actinomycetota bacterium]